MNNLIFYDTFTFSTNELLNLALIPEPRLSSTRWTIDLKSMCLCPLASRSFPACAPPST